MQLGLDGVIGWRSHDGVSTLVRVLRELAASPCSLPHEDTISRLSAT